MSHSKPRTLLLSSSYYYLARAPVEYLPPIHLLYIASFLETHGYTVELFDTLAEFGVQHDAAEIKSFLPKLEQTLGGLEGDYGIVGISCYTSLQYLASLDLARVVRKVFPRSLIVVGGYHPSAVASDFLFPGSPIDCVVRGEGEAALLALLEMLQQGLKIPPIWSAPAIPDINQLPPLNYQLLKNWSKYSYYYDYLSRGCPFSCRFCMEASMPDRRWRPLSIDKVRERLAHAESELGKSLIEPSGLLMLNDPLFGGKRSWLKEVLGILGKNNRSYRFFASPRVDILDVECIDLFAKAGFAIDLPVEHGAQAQIERMQKSKSPASFLSHAKNLAVAAQRASLPFHTHWVMGHPGETRETLEECLAYMQELHHQNTHGMTEVFYFKLYPGSWLSDHWQQVKREWGAVEEISEYWKLQTSLDQTPYHIHPSHQLSRTELMEWVEEKMKPAGEAINQRALVHHAECCGQLRKENAAWIL